MRRTLHLRIAVIGITVMALTLVIVALLTSELIQVSGRQDIDRILQQEIEEVRLGLPRELQAAAGDDGVASAAELDLAVQRYLAVHPGSDRHLTVIEIGSHQLSTRDGPPALKQLVLLGTLPAGEPGSLLTVDSDAGRLRVLRAPLRTGSTDLGMITVVGSLADTRAQAQDALVRIAAAGFIGLALGGLILVLTLRRALQPVRALAAAARSVDLTDLQSRVPIPRRSDEVGLMAREFNRMLERITKDQQQRGELLSAVAHELRTPLAVAQGHLELFETLDGSERASAADTAAVVRRELVRLSRILDDLTALSAGNLGASTAHEPVFAPDVLATLRRRLDALDIRDVSVAEASPVVLLGDEDRLAQALVNLVLNARTHTPPDTPVRVEAHATHGRVVFQVLDEGPGIDPALQMSVFEPFMTTRPGGSTRTSGLGLTVVKAVTEAQGGQIRLVSDRLGTRVTLSFPVDTTGRDCDQ